MKKRKPPIVLGTILLLLLGGIVMMNLPKAPPADPNNPEQGHEESPTAARPGAEPGALSSDIKNTMKSPGGPPPGGRPQPVGAAPGSSPSGSKVTIPIYKPTAPQPDDNSITSLRGPAGH